jgi:hypothetical protein
MVPGVSNAPNLVVGASIAQRAAAPAIRSLRALNPPSLMLLHYMVYMKVICTISLLVLPSLLVGQQFEVASIKPAAQTAQDQTR